MLRIDRLIVLVADDDEVVRKVIMEHLELFGIKNILEARDGSEAYRFVVDSTQRIDLIISDWEMPRTDGLTFLRAVRSTKGREDTPFIMVTSQQSQERVKISKAKQHHVDSYIVKPFKGDVLREKIMHVLFEAEKKKSESGVA
ncbi:MAG: response regulator [Pseudobdellovibrionaceae bacterium]|jgi:two-component system chemotaxis response regulator CheY